MHNKIILVDPITMHAVVSFFRCICILRIVPLPPVIIFIIFVTHNASYFQFGLEKCPSELVTHTYPHDGSCQFQYGRPQCVGRQVGCCGCRRRRGDGGATHGHQHHNYVGIGVWRPCKAVKTPPYQQPLPLEESPKPTDCPVTNQDSLLDAESEQCNSLQSTIQVGHIVIP